MTLLGFHRTLVSDQVGQDAYRRAIAAAVTPGDVVLDLGTGTGVHALFACRAGARRVYAVDPSPIIEIARAVLDANGHGDRATCIQAGIEDLDPPEKVDVLVANLGVDDLFALLPGARARVLKPGGRVVPQTLELFVAPLETPDAYGRLVDFWTAPLGIDFAPARAAAVNATHDVRIRPEERLADGAAVGRFTFAGDEPARLSARVTFPIARPGTLHGFGTWMIQQLWEDVTVSTAPPNDLAVDLWPNTFFPLARPLGVEVGDFVRLDLRTGAGGWGRVWQWRAELADAAGRVRERSDQSTFAGELVSRAALGRQAPEFSPSITPRGAALRLVLERSDGAHTIAAIEDELSARFPALFSDRDAAARFVAAGVARHGR